MRKWICALALASSAASSSPFVYEFTGHITSIFDAGGPSPGFHDWFPDAGDAFTGRFTWSPGTLVPAVPPEDYDGSARCVGDQFCGGADDLTVTFDGLTLYESDPAARMVTESYENLLRVSFWFLNRAHDPANAVLAEYMWVDLEFAEPLGDLRALDALPIDTLTGGAMYFKDGGDYDEFIGAISSLRVASEVPEPATLGLLGIGVAGLVAARRRKR